MRIQEVLDGGSSRRLRPLAPIHPAILLIGTDASPIVVGTRDDSLTIARGQPDGSWRVATTDVAAQEVQLAVRAHDGAVWTLTTSSGIDQRDRWLLARDGVGVTVTTPEGTDISPRDLGVDATLGIVVRGRGGDTNWIAAERPPVGVGELP